ncbi:plasmid pRiA4b ORF-3 family protein [uncultured Slackia sp.]|uniref:plasmid pRiA4b ORF-3 family protein n=1 Tax=uncultured Slackia sp. TaxID=665903 RepID=UPI0025CF2CCD|nr:plasmid pRiA4b ORF-3 family protein [uncultured Slackia sp.]
MDENLRKGLINDLTLMLLYLTSQSENASGVSVRRAEKTYAQEAIESLSREGLISTSRASDSVYLTDAACKQAEFLSNAFLDFEDGMIESLCADLEERKKHSGAFRLRVELDLDGLHPCWREIVVPAWFTFADLHQAIQAVFLWQDAHLYDFKLRTHGEDLMLANPDAFGVDAMFAPSAGKHRAVDDMSVYLDEVFPRTRVAYYTYDYGCNWEHKIKLVETLKDYSGGMPACADGEGDAPPEDVGFVPGFEHFLKAISNADDPNHDEMAAWGYAQCYEPFSLDAVNRRIGRWGSGEFFDELERRQDEWDKRFE